MRGEALQECLTYLTRGCNFSSRFSNFSGSKFCSIRSEASLVERAMEDSVVEIMGRILNIVSSPPSVSPPGKQFGGSEEKK